MVSSSKREDPGNEKAVCLSPKKQSPVCFAAIILFYICEMFMASLTRRFVSAETLQRPLAKNISQVFDNCLLLYKFNS